MQSTHAAEEGLAPSKFLCLTILGYRKPGMSEEAYRRHMHTVSAPLTKDLMVKYGVKRWTMVSHSITALDKISPSSVLNIAVVKEQQIHNPVQTRILMNELFDQQMSNVADYDCFSQVVFESLNDYKRMKEDPYYRERLFGDHENFADTKNSLMTIGWIEEWVNNASVRNGLEFETANATSV